MKRVQLLLLKRSRRRKLHEGSLSFLGWRYSTQPRCVRAALPYLAKGTGIGRTTVHSYLNRLEELGFIKCLEVNHDLGNLYQIQETLLWTEPQSSELQPSQGEQSQEEKLKKTPRLRGSRPKSELL